MQIKLDTPIIDLYRYHIAKLSSAMSRKLAVEIAAHAGKANVDSATVNNLLNYLPARYEDRSNFLQINELVPGMEAAVELYVRNVSGRQVGRDRDRRNLRSIFLR